MDWERHAARLAEDITDPVSRWREPVAHTARHALVPKWWERADSGWQVRDGAADPEAWATAAYSDTSLVTRVGPLHADHAAPDDRPIGRATSSATMPGLVVQMLRHGRLTAGVDLLDVGTGAGGLTAYACRRLGAEHVTSVDVDPYLTEVARERLAAMDMHPTFETVDATGPLPGTYDRIIATVAVRPVPASWLAALRPGGRLVTTIANTSLILTAWKDPDGGAIGRIERDWAGFMPTRHGDDYPPGLADLVTLAWVAGGLHVTAGRFPVMDIAEAWEVRSMLEVEVPGVELDYRHEGDTRSAVLVHPDGSWARATAHRFAAPIVHEGGPRRLWKLLERIRLRLNVEGRLPLYGAHVRITPDGVCHLKRGGWTGTID
ncbi:MULTISPECIES: methyltransferase domain-containing protein [Streptomycetaceae]|uniref:methyltransferase domain-containing protein n=1 Tax=Embleya scabrispora TaxID=159449 RepID=UPI0003625E97|nr:methyltransferase domain-containing protein [Embleya scabrispora]MYS83600.1 methyltransferase domain-containing protein [Streptomyces sp. SID5474]